MTVDWAIAEDEAMRRVVHAGQASAEPQWAHSVHVEVGGLTILLELVPSDDSKRQ